MNQKTHRIDISVDIPALSELVAYLREKDDQQAAADALTLRVLQATGRLRTSTAALANAVNQSTPEIKKETNTCHSTT